MLLIPHVKPGGGEAYLMDLELLETTCHVLDPTPVANCTVRPKYLTVSLTSIKVCKGYTNVLHFCAL